MINWFFGASSQWSQKVISGLTGTTVQFGRTENKELGIQQAMYTPSLFINWLESLKNLDTPDRIIFNLNIGTPAKLLPYTSKTVLDNYKIFNQWWEDNNTLQFFKYNLLDYLITERGYRGDVCLITSQISADHNPAWSHLFTYKSLRAIDYELIWNFRNKGVNAYGVCPATNARPLEWAEYISKFIQKESTGKKEWLYGVVEDENSNKLSMLNYSI